MLQDTDFGAFVFAELARSIAETVGRDDSVGIHE